MRNILYSLVLTALLLNGCAGATIKSSDANPVGFYKVSPRLYRGGQPSEQNLIRLSTEYGVRTIIDVTAPDKQSENEATAAEKIGMHYIRLPLSLDQRPDDEQILTFLNAILTPEACPVYVHGKTGHQTTSMMVAIYRTVLEGWGPKTAYKEAKKHGFQPFTGNAVQKDYIHQLKDKKIFFELAGTIPAE